VLCFIMIVAGLVWAFFASRMNDRDPVRLYTAGEAQAQKTGPAGEQAGKNRQRKLRKRLK